MSSLHYGFGPFKARSFMQSKCLIETRSIVGVTIILERKEIFGEDKESSHVSFFLHGLFLNI